VSDPLSYNTHNWETGDTKKFKDGAYHLTTPNGSALSVLADPVPPKTATITVTAQAISGDFGDPFNLYGIVLRYNSNKDKTTFYAFQLSNSPDGDTPSKYHFQKYDSSQTPQWPDDLWTGQVGNEVHQGKGQSNTFKVVADKDHFTFYVNNTKVGDVKDGTFADGQMGLYVNLKGNTEVAFKNLLVTKK
jgi:hypothetical protein